MITSNSWETTAQREQKHSSPGWVWGREAGALPRERGGVRWQRSGRGSRCSAAGARAGRASLRPAPGGRPRRTPVCRPRAPAPSSDPRVRPERPAPASPPSRTRSLPSSPPPPTPGRSLPQAWSRGRRRRRRYRRRRSLAIVFAQAARDAAAARNWCRGYPAASAATHRPPPPPPPGRRRGPTHCRGAGRFRPRKSSRLAQPALRPRSDPGPSGRPLDASAAALLPSASSPARPPAPWLLPLFLLPVPSPPLTSTLPTSPLLGFLPHPLDSPLPAPRSPARPQRGPRHDGGGCRCRCRRCRRRGGVGFPESSLMSVQSSSGSLEGPPSWSQLSTSPTPGSAAAARSLLNHTPPSGRPREGKCRRARARSRASLPRAAARAPPGLLPATPGWGRGTRWTRGRPAPGR